MGRFTLVDVRVKPVRVKVYSDANMVSTESSDDFYVVF